MPLLRLDADAYPFLLIEMEVFAFVGPDPGLFYGVAGEGYLVTGRMSDLRFCTFFNVLCRRCNSWNLQGEYGEKEGWKPTNSNQGT